MSSIMRCRSGLIVLLVIGILLSCEVTNPTSSDRKPRPVTSTLNPGAFLRVALYRESGFVLWPIGEDSYWLPDGSGFGGAAVIRRTERALLGIDVDPTI